MLLYNYLSMKLIYLLLLGLFFIPTSAAAQTAPEQKAAVKDSLYYTRYNTLMGLYLKQINSESHKKYRNLLSSFIKKMNYDRGKEGLLKTTPMEWVEKNIEKTDFKNLEEARQEDEIIGAALEEEIKANGDYYKHLQEMFRAGESQMMTDVMMEVIRTFPEMVGYPTMFKSF